MATESRQNRKDNRINGKLDRIERKINSIDESLKDHVERHIVDDLQQPRFPGSDKKLYTYEEIADRYNISISMVQRIAKEYGLERYGVNKII